MKLPQSTATLLLGLAMGLPALPAWADIGVRFIEGAPKDRFEITNLAGCATVATEVVIDLSTSTAGLVFDTTGQGAGVEVFQPFELVSGAKALAKKPKVVDGDTQLVLSIQRLAAGQRITFTIDVDDTVSARGITVSGAEIEGAQVRVSGAGTSHTARFSSQGQVVVATPACT